MSEITKSHSEFLNEFGLTVDTKDMDLPKFYAIPKLHKNPYKFRFIAASKFC